MDKTGLIEAVHLNPATPDLTKKAVGEVVAAVFDTIAAALASGEKVTLVGFGSFEAKQRKERLGRNPKTGEEMTIPAAMVPRFSPGKEFKAKVAA